MKKQVVCSIAFLSTFFLALSFNPQFTAVAQQSNKIKNPEAYFLLDLIGAKWEYTVQASKPIIYTDQNGEKYHAKDWKEIQKIESKKIINGKKYSKGVTIYSGMPGRKPSLWYGRIDNKGIYWTSDDLLKKNKDEYMSTPLPLQVGKTWHYISPYLGHVINNKMVGIEDLYLPDKTYSDCIVIETEYVLHSDNNKYKNTTYLAPNVGMVKSIKKNMTKNLIIEKILVKFSKP